jgi:hypothetical protein
MRFARVPVQDEYVEGDRRAVLVDLQVIALSSLGHTILSALDAGHDTTGAIRDFLVLQLGVPTEVDTTARTAEALADLVAAGLVAESSDRGRY